MVSSYQHWGSLALPLLCLSARAAAEQYDIGSRGSIINTASTLAYDLMSFYNGNATGEIPGIFPGAPDSGPDATNWWLGGVLMETLIDYWHLTGDSSYNDIVTEGLTHQFGARGDFLPRNQTAQMSNDAQGLWALSTMAALEYQLPNPPRDSPSWLEVTEEVAKQLNDLFDAEQELEGTPETPACNGGIRWMLPVTGSGWEYKNAITNGVFFSLSARLARYTGEDKYARQAEKAWDWLYGVEFIDHDNWRVYDGASTKENCTRHNKVTFSMSSAVLMQGAAFMYNYTSSDTWSERVENLGDRMLQDFLKDDVLFEVPCESRIGNCVYTMLVFKGITHRWLSTVAQMAPFMAEKLLPSLRKSAQAAVDQCTGGSSGRACGFYWREGEYVEPNANYSVGASEQMNVLAAVSSLLIDEADAPVTVDTATKGDDSSSTSSAPSPTSTETDGSATTHSLVGSLAWTSLGCFLWVWI